jgi:hypothetical protein
MKFRYAPSFGAGPRLYRSAVRGVADVTVTIFGIHASACASLPCGATIGIGCKGGFHAVQSLVGPGIRTFPGANWLPAPAGPFMMAMRYYWPKPELLCGTRRPPVLAKPAIKKD